MKLEDFRTTVALLSRHALAEIATVSPSSIQRIEEGGTFSKLTKGKILAGLSKHLGRQVQASEIDEFANNNHQ